MSNDYLTLANHRHEFDYDEEAFAANRASMIEAAESASAAGASVAHNHLIQEIERLDSKYRLEPPTPNVHLRS